MRSSLRSLVAHMVFGLSLLSCAEPALGQRISPGLELTTNFSSLVYDEPMEIWDPSARVSFGLKGYADIPVAGRFHLRPGVRLYRIQNRVHYAPTPPTSQIPEGEFSTVQDYLSIPIQIVYFVLNGPFFVTFGPEPAYLLASSMDIPESSGPMPDADDLTHRMQRFNLAVAAGFGAAFRLNNHRLHANVRLSRGFTGVAKNSRTFSWSSDWVTQEIGLAIGYTL